MMFRNTARVLRVGGNMTTTVPVPSSPSDVRCKCRLTSGTQVMPSSTAQASARCHPLAPDGADSTAVGAVSPGPSGGVADRSVTACFTNAPARSDAGAGFDDLKSQPSSSPQRRTAKTRRGYVKVRKSSMQVSDFRTVTWICAGRCRHTSTKILEPVRRGTSPRDVKSPRFPRRACSRSGA